MRLFAKRVVFIVANGVSEDDFQYLRRGLERESAETFTTTAEPYLIIETSKNDTRGNDIYIDFPIELADPELFDALVIPDGEQSIESICTDPLAIKVVRSFHMANKPIIVSGEAVRVLHEQALYPGQIVVREGKESSYFLGEAIESISSYASTHINRPTSSRVIKEYSE